MVLTARLDSPLERELEKLSRTLAISKSQIVKESLKLYLQTRLAAKSPYLLGVDLFGRAGSRDGSLSTSDKSFIRKKISAKSTR